MASRRGVRRRAAKDCERKTTYQDREEIERAMRYIERTRGLDPGVLPYVCPACRKWHLGHGGQVHKTSHQAHDRRAITRRRSRYAQGED